ncbi:violacein biosynthesis protein VioE [Pseudoalteromonas luteoviolacea]|uniref:Violacein biosynthesis protein VioE n=1 Tax=Pseudoalteromonas luteoviolacea TaxID=43657 RepID=A0A0C1MS06_9GAMM|nr:violacein biosynthesis enzyme VioE [Pseudoalteromonas luteoviolacea]KID57463.1 violacein biosynthesis protein VioE [Pseudoalteromonas luteoviolacea]
MDLHKQKQRPKLPAQWSTSYISYWQPMQPDDHITSGYCWFDYTRNVCRIDGLFNPWSEEKTGHRLWMSEIMYPATNESFKSKVAYSREHMDKQSTFTEQVLNDEVDPCHELILMQDVLELCDAQFQGTCEVLGFEADIWHFQRPNGKGPATYYFKADTNQLLRMVTGDPQKMASVRDFPNFNTREIDPDIFQHVPLKQPE